MNLPIDKYGTLIDTYIKVTCNKNTHIYNYFVQYIFDR